MQIFYIMQDALQLRLAAAELLQHKVVHLLHKGRLQVCIQTNTWSPQRTKQGCVRVNLFTDDIILVKSLVPSKFYFIFLHGVYIV